MPFASQIRKYILRPLDQFIIPALQGAAVPQILAGPPWDFSEVEHWTLRQRYLPHKAPEPTIAMWEWEKEQLVANRMPCICFTYEGVVNDIVGITTKMAKEADSKETGIPTPRGITALRLSAPAVICYPPGVPWRPGSGLYGERGHPEYFFARAILIQILNGELLVHYYESDTDKMFSSHSLQIRDVILSQLAYAYMDELCHMHNDTKEGAQGILLGLMKRLRRYLTTAVVSLSNSAWPLRYLPQQKKVKPKSEDLFQRAIAYIDTHLQDSISWEMLAQRLEVSPFYLNYVFHKSTDMSIMRYVNSRRIEAAKRILASEHEIERVNDIAQLTGFSSLASFSASFKRKVGCSPSEFRSQTLKAKPPKVF